MPALVQSDIEINASASRVWAILTEFERYYEWNPFITSIEGDLHRGRHLELTLEPPDRTPFRVRPKVLECSPMGRLVLQCGRGDHQIVLEPISTGVRVSQLQRAESNGDEDIRLLHDRIQLGFEMMNHALKARAER